MTGYTDIIRQWATDNRRAGNLSNPDGIGEIGLESSEVGKRLAVRFALRVNHDRVADIRYQVFGCGFTVAACAVAADLAIGNALDDIQRIDRDCVDTALKGLPDERSYCAELAVEALHAAVESARCGRQPVQAKLSTENKDGPRVSDKDPVYATLIQTAKPEQASAEDRHLFACLLAVASQESDDICGSLGLNTNEIDTILKTFFPQSSRSTLEGLRQHSEDESSASAVNPDLLALLRSYIPEDIGAKRQSVAGWLVKILAARAVIPGHLWVAMGLFERPQLSAAIHRHLPALAKANYANMRWKRFLYKQICDRNGGIMCKSPNCGDCSDYVMCFVDDD